MAGFPRKFGKFVLLKPLAQGGMGALYLAVSGDPGMEKLCCIKTVLPHLADPEYLARFRDEAKVVVKLTHGNLVPVFDAGQFEGELYLAMEFIEGKDLRAVWNKCAQKGIAFPVDIAVHLTKEVCRGLDYAHSFGGLELVHRDVSPPNVLCAFSGEVKLTDFGLASSTLKLEKTAPGVIYGKVSYMAPEQARGEPLDGRTDIYAAGIILWELLTGRQLFPQGKLQAADVLNSTRNPTIDPPSKRTSRVPPALDAIVLRSLAVDAAARYQTAEEMRAALAEFLATEAPATDAARMAAFLKDLFGEEIERERRERDDAVAQIPDLLREAASDSGRRPAADAHAATRPALGAGPAPGAVPGASVGVGTLLDGRYKIRSLIGEGGMGRVYEAEHIEIGKRVAIKILHPVYSRTPEVVERFRREARAASRIGHPNIVDVTDSGTTADGSVYFVMEFLEGVELADIIDREGALAVPRALEVAVQICRALAAAHAAGIIHRDLKPENIFIVAREGTAEFVKVLDFGIAKSAELEEKRTERLTHPGMAMGTPEYMAPEQAAGKPSDFRVDIYAAGAILYEMITGVPPYDGENFMEILSKKANEPPVPPRVVRPDVPEVVEQVVLKAMARDPAARFASMEVFEYELTKALSGRGAAVAKILGIGAGATDTDDALAAAALSRPYVVPQAERQAPAAPAAARPARWRVYAIVGAVVLVGGAGAVWVLRDRLAAPGPALAGARDAGAALAVAPPAPADAAAASAPAAHDAARAAPEPVEPKVERTPVIPDPKEKPRHPIAEGKRLLAARRYAAAREAFLRARDSGHARGAALTGLGEVAFQQGDFHSALKQAQSAVRAGGGADAHLLLGNCHFRLGHYAEAITEYKKVLAQRRGHAEARRNLEAAQKRLGGRGT
ncbi:MAG TPA: protein kinase [Polyangia bacterium]|jgi:serine/threonine protein kinase